MARPTKLTTAKQRQIVRLLEAGNYRETVCRACGIGTSTLYRWLERGAVEESGVYGGRSGRCPAHRDRRG